MDINTPIRERLEKGASVLAAMEQRGEGATERYERWLRHWLELLATYENEEDERMQQTQLEVGA